MLVYRSIKTAFLKDVESGGIDQIIHNAFRKNLFRSTSEKEQDSWFHSMQFMHTILTDGAIPGNSGISIECQIPQTSKRIDFIISGRDEKQNDQVVIIELKQWKSSELTDKDGIVRTALGKGLHETSHPSYQAWSYAMLLEDFSSTVQDEKILLQPCAYLHNYEDDNVIRNEFYQEYINKAPVFLKRDTDKLRSFIKQFVKHGDDGDTMYRIDKGKIRPSKQLAESLSAMLSGNKEFLMIDDQKLVYETALQLTRKSLTGDKQVLIIQGGPGTGKSVVAINLLIEITNRKLLTQYVSKNAAPRAVYQSKLTGTLKKTRFEAMFQGSGSFINTSLNEFDALIVDEAHRLNLKSGMFKNKGENQIKEIINASKCSVFFLDEDQKVTMHDIGSRDEIITHAKILNASVTEMDLSSQFRCNGSDGYLAFIDNLLQIRETANTDVKDLDYDFQILDRPDHLRDLIFEKNKEKNSARLIAGYCWDWKSQRDPKVKDIIFLEFNFAMKWNLAVDSSLWIIKPDSVNEVGCIHTCQGLELDYAGIIVGPDLIVRDGVVLVDPSKRSKMDSSIKGYKKMLSKKPEEAKDLIRKIIKNTYRTLMTRGMKGCYVYCVDKETREYFKDVV
jgi:DUF2075 family protein